MVAATLWFWRFPNYVHLTLGRGGGIVFVIVVVTSAFCRWRWVIDRRFVIPGGWGTLWRRLRWIGLLRWVLSSATMVLFPKVATTRCWDAHSFISRVPIILNDVANPSSSSFVIRFRKALIRWSAGEYCSRMFCSWVIIAIPCKNTKQQIHSIGGKN